MVVPVTGILSFDLELSKLEALRTFRTAVEKWQLSSEDHARIPYSIFSPRAWRVM